MYSEIRKAVLSVMKTGRENVYRVPKRKLTTVASW
jgi:hypothetical protein